jgi:hypothetical protein
MSNKFKLTQRVYNRMTDELGMVTQVLENFDYLVRVDGKAESVKMSQSCLDPTMHCGTCEEEMPHDHMAKGDECGTCVHWASVLVHDPDEYTRVRTIEGEHYMFKTAMPLVDTRNEPYGSKHLGCAGRVFVIEFFEDDTFVTTNNLWCQGTMTPYWQKQFPPNAVRHEVGLLTGAQYEQAKALGLDPVAGFGGGIVVPVDKVMGLLERFGRDEFGLMCYDYGKANPCPECSEEGHEQVCIHWNGVTLEDFEDGIDPEYRHFEVWRDKTNG